MSESTPTCPRCGYDLSGHTATWETSCPLGGQCSECGLRFAWREVLRDDERENPRHVEHCSRRAIPFATVRTLLWCALPWVFWKRVKLHHEPRVGRMAAWLVIVLLGAQLLSGAAVGIALWRVDVRAVEEANRGLTTTLNSGRALVARLERQQQAGEFAAMDAARLRRVQQFLANPPPPLAIPVPQLRHFAKGVSYPFAYVEDHGDPAAQMTPNALFPGPIGPAAPDWQAELLRFWRNPPFVVGAAMSLGFPIMLLILPATRRRLRIRTGHLLRASIFGLAWLVIPAMHHAIVSVSFIVGDLTGSAGGGGQLFLVSSEFDWPLWVWIIGVWIGLWWLCALWRGLRFSQPLFHWILLSVPVAIVAVAALAFVLDPLAISALFDLELFRDAPGYGVDFTPNRLARGRVDRMP